VQKYDYPQNGRTESEKYVEAHISNDNDDHKLTEVNTTEMCCTNTDV